MDVTDGAPAFPLLAFDRLSFSAMRSADDLTIAWTSLIRSGWFDELRLVDAEGRTFEVTGIEKLGGVGPFWGFNPLYGRRVRLRVSTRIAAHQLSLEEVRAQILKKLRAGDSVWRSRDDYDELVDAIANAPTLEELIHAAGR